MTRVYDDDSVYAGMLGEREIYIVAQEKCVYLTPGQLADIAEAVAQHLEIESAAEYVDDFLREHDLL